MWRRANSARQLIAPRALELFEPRAQSGGRRVDLDPRARLGVDQGQTAERWELALARIVHLDRQHTVAGANRAQQVLPAVLIAEVGDDRDQTGTLGQPEHVSERRRQRARVDLPVLADARRRAALAPRPTRGARSAAEA